MKLVCVIFAILTTSAARDLKRDVNPVEDLLAEPTVHLSSKNVEAPVNIPYAPRGTQKFKDQLQSRYYYPQNNNIAPSNNYDATQRPYVPSQNNYLTNPSPAPSQSNYWTTQSPAPSQNYYWTTQSPAPAQNNYWTTQSPAPSQNYYWTTQSPVPSQNYWTTQRPSPSQNYWTTTQRPHVPTQQTQNTWNQNVGTGSTTPTSVIKNEYYTGENGSYRYEYQLTDGTWVGEEGYFLYPGTENQTLVKKGWYSYVGADKYTYLVTYWADNTGYHASYRRYLQ